MQISHHSMKKRLAAPSPLGLTLQTVGLLAIVPLLFKMGQLVVEFSPFLAVALGWIWLMLPGFILSLILLKRLSWIEQIPVAFALAIGVSTPYTIAAILLHMKLDHYIGISIGVYALLVLVLLVQRLLVRDAQAGIQEEAPEIPLSHFAPETLPYLFALVLLVGLLAFLSSQWLPAGDDVAGLPPVAEVLRRGQIVGTEPFHGTDTPVTPRNELIVWAYQGILVAKVAGASPLQLFMNSRPILIILAFLSMFVFLHYFFRDRHLALYLLTLWAIFLLSTTRVEGMGSDLITRIMQDKFVGWFVIVPIILVFMLWFLRSQRWRYLLVFGLGAFGAALLHPITLTQVLILGGSFGLLYLAFERSRRTWRALVLLAFVLALCLVIPAIQYLRYKQPMPVELAGLEDAIEFGRISMAVNRHRLWLLDGNAFILHPSIVLQPVILLGYLLLPLLAFRLGKSNVARLIVGSMIALALLLYVPPLAALLGLFVTPYLLWRLAWPMSALSVLTIGWVAWLLVGRITNLVRRSPARISLCVQYGGPLAVVLIALSLMRPDIYAGLGNFRERYSAAEFSVCWTARHALARLDQLAYDKPVNVLASQALNFCIPGNAALANVVEFRGYGTVNRLPADMIHESMQRVEDVNWYGSTTRVDDLIVDMLERYDIDFVLMENDRTDLDLQFRHLPSMFSQVYTDDLFTIYAVSRPLRVSVVVEGNGMLRQRQWKAAEKIFRQSIQDDPDQVLAYLGLGMAVEGQGRVEEALDYYLQASQQAESEAGLHARAAETYLLLQKTDHAAAEYERAVSLAPNRYAFLNSLGLAYLLIGQEGKAKSSFERSAALRAPECTAAYYSLLGKQLMSVNWISQAVESYRHALALEPEPTRYADLAEALARSGDVETSILLNKKAIRLDRWQNAPHFQLGHIYQTEGQLDLAIQEYETAWRLNPVNSAAAISVGRAIQEKLGVTSAGTTQSGPTWPSQGTCPALPG